MGGGGGGQEQQEAAALKLLYTNAQSVFGKLNELSAQAADTRPDFILLTETWCNPTITTADLTIPGYQLEQDLRRDREDTANGIGGGLLVYSKNCHRILPTNIKSEFHQYVSFKIISTENPLNIVLVYRPPSSGKENVQKLCQMLRNLPKNSIVIGDINLPRIDWSGGGAADAQGRELYNAVLGEDLAQLILFPTHDKGNTLDLLITNMANDIISVYDDGKLGKSDHCIVMAEIVTQKVKNKGPKKAPNWTKADFLGIRSYLANIDWDTLMENRSAEEAWTILREKINTATEKYVPKSTVKKDTEPRWINREIIKLIRQKKRAWKIFKLFNTAESRDKYKYLENEVKKKIKTSKKGMEKKLANSKDGNSRKFANYIKSKTKTKISIGPLKSKDGKVIADEREMADELNTFFAAVFTEENLNNIPVKAPETDKSFCDSKITEAKIIEKIKNLKENSAAGPDGVGPKFLKTTMREIAKPLCIVFKLSLSTGEVPRDWKHARVTPIFKKGPKGDPGNYRPVSLTSIPCRILEAIIKDDMMEHLKNNQLLKDSQHGFLKGKSCTTNLTVFMDKITKVLDEGKCADIFYLDFAKAFDKVPHQRLLEKMKSKGIKGNVYNWISEWLTGRTQAVRVNEAESDPSDVKSGVPQGSVLGPPLFDIFIDDLDECSEEISLILKFADDTKGFQEIQGPDDRDKLQLALDKLVQWAETWGMKFNVPKCKIMHVGRNNPAYEYSMENENMTVVEEEKDIGVLIQKNLKPSKHCKKAADIASAVLRQLARNFHYRDKNTFKKLYIQYVRPHLEFAAPAWSPWLQEDKNKLERIQRKAVGMISGLKGGSYEEKCKELNIDTLEVRRERQDLLEAYRVVHSEVQENSQKVLVRQNERAGAATRATADPWKLTVPRARLDIRKNTFAARVPEKWNRLPVEIKNAPNLIVFKNALKRYHTGTQVDDRT